MHNRGVSKKMMNERGTEEEIEVVTDSEIEQQTDNTKETEVIMDTKRETVEEDAQGDQINKAGAREEPNWQEVMKFMAEQSRQTNENLCTSVHRYDKDTQVVNLYISYILGKISPVVTSESDLEGVRETPVDPHEPTSWLISSLVSDKSI